MNTDKLIPIDFSRNITPPIYGDHVWDEVRKYDFHISEENLTKICGRESNNNLYVISFASRPNTGTQPVADDISTDALFDGKWLDGIKANMYGWHLDEGITKWKLNHAALLAKFKEQGANTMNTHKETAHHIALQIEELGNQPQHHIDLAIGAGAINDVVISPDEPVLSETWLIDQFTEQKESACPGKPVFTQEQADAGIIPPVGMRAMFYVEEKDVNSWFPGLVCGEFMGKAVARLDDSEEEGYFDDYSADQCKPIGRTEEEKTRDKLTGFITGYTIGGFSDAIDDYVDELMQSFSITLNKE